MSNCFDWRPTICQNFKKTQSQFQLSSSAIANNGKIPIRYTCDGANVNPPLAWSNAFPQTKSYVIIVDDPDAIPVTGGIVTHFAVINIDNRVTNLEDDQDFFADNVSSATLLYNESKKVGWMGPCPPEGDCDHFYRFTIYAINVPLLSIAVKTKLTVEIFEKYYRNYILDKASFTAKYRRDKGFSDSNPLI